MSTLKQYCQQTSLHGWNYIANDKKEWKIVWGLIVLASIAMASTFIYTATEDFLNSTVVTTIQSTTVPLSEVYFPAVTVCNINQVSTVMFISCQTLKIISFMIQVYNNTEQLLCKLLLFVNYE